MSALDALLTPANDPVLAPEAPALAWPARLPDHLSASQLTMFERCSEQFRRAYIHGERQKPGGALVWGSADHFAHETNFRQKIASHEDIPTKDVQDAFAEGFDQAVKKANDDVDWGADNPGDLKDRGALLVRVYHETVSPSIQPVTVEARFKANIPGVPVPLVGYIDLETETTLIERKTTGKATKTVKPQWRLQGLLYQAVRELPVDWHISVGTKLPAILTPDTDPQLRLSFEPTATATAERSVRNTARAIVAFYNTFGPDDPWPGALTDAWACKFCGFLPTCVWHGHDPEPVDYGDVPF